MVKKRAQSRAGMVVLSVAFEKDLHRRLAIAAIDEHAAMNELIRQAVREWMERKGRQRKGRAKS